MNQVIPQNKQAGFISGMMLFGIALMVAVIAAMALANRDTSSSAASENAKANASALLKEGTTLSDAVGRYLADGNSVTNLDYTLSGTGALFDSTKQYAVTQSIPSGVFDGGSAAADRTWYLHKDVVVPGMGSATADYVHVAPDVSLEVCRRINNMLWGVTMASTPADAGGTLANFKTGTKQGGTAGTHTAITLGAATVLGTDAGSNSVTLNGKPEACVADAGGKFIYFKVAAQN